MGSGLLVPILIAESLVALALPLAFLARGWLEFRRDFLVLCVYLQALLYVHLAPLLRFRQSPDALPPSYAVLGGFAFLLLDAMFLAIYAWVVRGRPKGRPQDVRLDVSTRRLDLLIAAFLAFSLAFWAIAWSRGLMFRRIGGILTTEQLKLPLVEFVIYRSYIEGLRYLIAVVVAVVVVAGSRVTLVRGIPIFAIFVSAYLYLVINSRLDLALNLLLAMGVWVLLWPGRRGFWPRFLSGGILSAVLLLYSTATTEKIRVEFAATGEIPWRAFVPGLPPRALPSAAIAEEKAPAPIAAEKTPEQPPPAPSGVPAAAGVSAQGAPPGKAGASMPGVVSKVLEHTFLYRSAAETAVTARMDGLDLISRLRPGLLSNGYAWGRAWKLPAALIVLPVTNPARAREYKMRSDASAKNYLMRNYAHMQNEDYPSCILTDAYGNFGILGFAAVGLVLGAGLGFSVRALRWPARAVFVVLALFFIAHLFQFEQEFVNVLLLWTKKLPMLLGVLILNPFRVVAGASPPS